MGKSSEHENLENLEKSRKSCTNLENLETLKNLENVASLEESENLEDLKNLEILIILQNVAKAGIFLKVLKKRGCGGWWSVLAKCDFLESGAVVCAATPPTTLPTFSI